MSRSALVIVDVQNDFLPPDGTLAVPDGRSVIPIIQELLTEEYKWELIIPTQGHISFASTHSCDPFHEKRVKDARGMEYAQTMWPDHCVVGTKGVEIEQTLGAHLEPLKEKMRLVRKGWHSGIEAYSAFEGYLTDPSLNDEPDEDGPAPPKTASEETDLAKYLREQGVSKVVITGLATDYCVKSTALSALEAGFETIILEEGIRGIDEEGVTKTLEMLKAKGARLVKGDSWAAEIKRLIAT